MWGSIYGRPHVATEGGSGLTERLNGRKERRKKSEMHACNLDLTGAIILPSASALLSFSRSQSAESVWVNVFSFDGLRFALLAAL